MHPKLSVIVPVYKVEPYLCLCLDSIVNQTFKDIEVICIDDGSPDNCGKICDNYAKNYENVKVIHKENGGLLNVWNDGMQLATGEYLTFVDSDDWIDIDFYERLFNALGGRTVDVFCSGGRYVERNGATKIVRTFDEPFFYKSGEHRAEMIARTLVQWPSDKVGGEFSAIWGMYGIRFTGLYS